MVHPSASINEKKTKQNSSIILRISLSERPLEVIYMDQESTVEAWDILIGFLRTHTCGFSHKWCVTQIESKEAYTHIIYFFPVYVWLIFLFLYFYWIALCTVNSVQES